MAAADVIIREVGLRDGLQLIDTVVPTERKIAWSKAALEAGLREQEVTSFVPAAYLPQFADAAAVTTATRAMPDLTAVALAPNLKGAFRAIEAGATKINFLVTASAAFSHANLRRPIEKSLRELRELVAERPQGVQIIGGLSSAFGCTIEGIVPLDQVRRLAAGMCEAGIDELVLADTVGYANPIQVRRTFTTLASDLGELPLGAHFHDTFGAGAANAVAAFEAGVRIFDCAISGLGGCPNSPRARGNVATEDMVYLLESIGARTGVDLTRLLALADEMIETLGAVRNHSYLRAAGIPKTYPMRSLA